MDPSSDLRQSESRKQKKPSVSKHLSLSTRTTCNLQTRQYNSTLSVSATMHQRKAVEHIGFLRLSKNNPQLHKAFRIKLLSQNDLVRVANKNTAMPHALSISCAHQVIDTTLSAKTIVYNLLEQQTTQTIVPLAKTMSGLQLIPPYSSSWSCQANQMPYSSCF